MGSCISCLERQSHVYSRPVGKRTFGGLLDDGVKSGVRYILNNFFDGHKQDALDLLSGTYTIKKGLLPKALLCSCCLALHISTYAVGAWARMPIAAVPTGQHWKHYAMH